MQASVLPPQGYRHIFAALHVEAELHRIALPINVSPVTHIDNPNYDSVVVNLVDHPEITAPRGISACEVIAQRLSDP